MNTPPQQVCIGARISGEHVMLDADERRRHLYVVGQTGTGKSTILLNLIRQDLPAGEGDFSCAEQLKSPWVTIFMRGGGGPSRIGGPV
jgi:DNA helicase HerA-like ATPase